MLTRHVKLFTARPALMQNDRNLGCCAAWSLMDLATGFAIVFTTRMPSLASSDMVSLGALGGVSDKVHGFRRCLQPRYACSGGQVVLSVAAVAFG